MGMRGVVETLRASRHYVLASDSWRLDHESPNPAGRGLPAALLSACATGPSIRSDYDQKADFSRYRTFGYMSPLGTDKAGYSSLLTERLKDATRGQMEMRGYVYNTADPDLLINFNGKLQQKTQVTQAPPAIGPYYGYRSGFYGGWPGYGWGDTVINTRRVR